MARRDIIPYDPRLKPLARRLRKQMTKAERALWRRLRRKQMRGYSFYRQRPMDRFIVDFYAPELRLAIEVDGMSHDEPGAFEDDVERERRLEALGVHVLRFRNEEVLRDMDNVLRAIDGWIETKETTDS